MEIKYYLANFFIRMFRCRLARIAFEGERIVRLTFENDKNDTIQLDMDVPNFYKLRERLNKRKDI